MFLAEEALGIDFVNVSVPEGPAANQALAEVTFDSADRSAVAGRARSCPSFADRMRALRWLPESRAPHRDDLASCHL